MITLTHSGPGAPLAPTKRHPFAPGPGSDCDWSAVLRERHSYRAWMWPTGRLAAVRAARLVAFETLADWRLGPMSDDVALCVSELLSNALVHTRVPLVRYAPREVVLGLRYFPSSCLLLEVGDCDSRPPLLPSPAAARDQLLSLGQNGRGLVLVQELADALWWQRRSTGGKYVYARLDTPRYFSADGGPSDE